MPVLALLTPQMMVDPVQFGVLVVVNLAIGMMTPPVGICLFVACGIAGITLGKISRAVIPLVAVTNLARTLEKLQQRGLWLVGTAGEAEQELYQQDMTGPTVLVMGAEGKGMRRLTREHCDYLVRLPMAGSVSSLNVSVAAGVCLFEAVRQRAGKQK